MNTELLALVKNLQENLKGCIGASSYDIAWMARLRVDGSNHPRWPDLVDWLLEHQWPDGSWGGAIPYCHDRILCTLAALIALKECGRSTKEVAQATSMGERYIWNHLHFLHHDPVELVGFELILPTLLAQAHQLGIDVPTHSAGYGRLRATKLNLLPMEQLYKPGTSVAFSLEFLDGQVDRNQVQSLQGANGAIANSPATTAYFLLNVGDQEKALTYLKSVKARPEGPPAFYPFRTFEAAWVLEHLAFGGIGLEVVDSSVWDILRSGISETGAGIDPLFGINDGDTTAVVLHVLALAGKSVDPLILRRFEQPNTRTFRTFAFERNASVATNAHALEALYFMPDYPNRKEVSKRILTLLLGSQKYQSYWIDKWHASPYYATAHVLIALARVKEPLLGECLHSIEWLLHTQREDGSWGFFDQGTVEETAYALLALLHCYCQGRLEDVEVLKRGVGYLQQALEEEAPFPELWIAKTLYMPENIVRAAIIATIALYRQVVESI